MSSRRTSSVPKEDIVFPRMLYCDSRCSQMLPGLSPTLPGALLCNATCRLGDGKLLILHQRVRGSVRAIRAVRNTRVFQTETSVVADVGQQSTILLLVLLTANPLKTTHAAADHVFCLGDNDDLSCEQSRKTDKLHEPNCAICMHQMYHCQPLIAICARTTIGSG
jgi:hypothetical protein